MKNTYGFVVLLIWSMASAVFAQGYSDGYYNPDSLKVITVSGTVVLDSSISFHPIYFLDTNNDKQPDYMLNFGPYWYEPDSSTAVRPVNGEIITVMGGSFSSPMMNYDMLVVYEINGEFWRDPYEPIWNNLDGFMNMGGHNNTCSSYSFGLNHDSLKTITISGNVFVDSTFTYQHYFIDVNNDSIPDYILNFGPPWYKPESGATYPKNGEYVSITGAEINMPHFNMLIVYNINDMKWRESTDLGPYFGGGWMMNSSIQPQKFHSAFDDSIWMVVHPGWNMGGMHGGMMMPDSIFAQIFEIFPNNLPYINNENAFAAFQFNLMYPSGRQGMGPGFGCGGTMQFNNNIDFQIHYTSIQLNAKNTDPNTLKVKYYNADQNLWIEMPGITINQITNTIRFFSNSMNNSIIITGEKSATGITDNQNSIVNNFKLFQNYPNPFNPSTNIRFELKENSYVTLSVYNVIGEKVADLVNSEMSAGIHNVLFIAKNLASGIYFYKLNAGTYNSVRKMQLLK